MNAKGNGLCTINQSLHNILNLKFVVGLIPTVRRNSTDAFNVTINVVFDALRKLNNDLFSSDKIKVEYEEMI